MPPNGSLRSWQLWVTQGAGYPRKIEKLQRSVEQTKAKTSLKSLENNDFTSAINERRVALTNLRRALALARGEYQEKSSATHEMRLDTDADLYDIQDAEKRSAELSASIKAFETHTPCLWRSEKRIRKAREMHCKAGFRSPKSINLCILWKSDVCFPVSGRVRIARRVYSSGRLPGPLTGGRQVEHAGIGVCMRMCV